MKYLIILNSTSKIQKLSFYSKVIFKCFLIKILTIVATTVDFNLSPWSCKPDTTIRYNFIHYEFNLIEGQKLKA